MRVDDGVVMAAHDPGLLPWVVVAGYAMAAVLTAVAARKASGRERLFWLFAASAVALLGINKQLDLQTQLTVFGRQLARDGGWYAERRTVQSMFIVGGVLMAGGVGACLMSLVRGLGAPVRAALAGLCLLGLFVMLRAAASYHVRVLGVQALDTQLHVWIELAGIAVMVTAPSWSVAQAPRRTRRKPGRRH